MPHLFFCISVNEAPGSEQDKRHHQKASVAVEGEALQTAKRRADAQRKAHTPGRTVAHSHGNGCPQRRFGPTGDGCEPPWYEASGKCPTFCPQTLAFNVWWGGYCRLHMHIGGSLGVSVRTLCIHPPCGASVRTVFWTLFWLIVSISPSWAAPGPDHTHGPAPDPPAGVDSEGQGSDHRH